MVKASRHGRLTGSGAFELIFRAGRRSEGEFLQMVSMATTRPCGRVGFVIGRKALPRAVDRNRVRRMLRVVLRAVRPAIGRLDLIVRVKRGAPRTEYPLIIGEAQRMLAALAAEQRSR